MSWHLEAETVVRYQKGQTDRVASASVEAHMGSCRDCRRLVVTDPGWTESSWSALSRVVDGPNLSGVERLLTAAGVKHNTARLLAVTPSMKPAWLLSMVLLMAFAAVASSSRSGFNLFLALAPLLPVLGVGLAYGRVGDSAHEVTVSSPFDPVRLLLLRTGAVTLTTLLVAGTVDLVAGSASGFGLWLLPSLTLTVVTLALGTRMTLWLAALATTGFWALLVAAVAAPSSGVIEPIFASFAQLASLAVLGVGALIFSARHDNYRRAEI